MATPEVLPEVDEDSPEATGWPGAPGAVTPVPPEPGSWITVSEYGCTVTDDVELPVAEVIEVPLSA